MYKTLFQLIDPEMRKHADKSNASSMEAYMKGMFDYYGIKSPVRKEIESSVIKLNPKLYKELDMDVFMEESWNHEKREMQYVGLDILERKKGWSSLEDLGKVEDLIMRKSWWDSVDGLAANSVGRILKNHPVEKRETLERLIRHENMWMRRTALICQLKHRTATDFECLCECILLTAYEKEFFIRKAAGWALRQYSKTDGMAVRRFIRSNESKLSGLTIREGLKWLERQNN